LEFFFLVVRWNNLVVCGFFSVFSGVFWVLFVLVVLCCSVRLVVLPALVNAQHTVLFCWFGFLLS